jgi:hypothetical protein
MLTLESLNPRNLWPVLPHLTRLFILFLCVTSVYALIVLAHILFRLRSLKWPRSAETAKDLRSPLAAMNDRLNNLRQLLVFAFYLFSLCFLLQIPAAFSVLVDSNVPTLSIIFTQLGTYIAYATDVFFVFLLLHSLQWFVSSRVKALAGRRELS